MAKLKRYANFEALKSKVPENMTPSKKDADVLPAFELFLSQLSRQYSSQKEFKQSRGK